MPGAPSPTDDALTRLMAAEAGGDEVDLSIGDPDTPLADELLEVAVASLRDHRTGYTPKLGLTTLREAVAADVAAHTGYHAAVEDVVVTIGGTGAVAVALAAVCAGGHGSAPVLVPDPAWPNYRVLAEQLGVPVLRYRQGPSGEDFLDLDEVARGLASGARLVVVNSPSNPTGAIASARLLAEVTGLARSHGAWVLADEAYEQVVLAGGRAPSALVGGGHDVTLSARTFSKTYSMTGLRVGALISPPAWRSAVAALHGTTAGCAPITGQLVARAALDLRPGPGAALVARFRRRFTRAVQVLGPWAPAGPVDKLGGFYLWVDARPTGLGSVEVCRELRAQGVLASAGTVYTPADGWVRLALTAPDDALDRAVRTVRETLDRLAAHR